jgi:hypothetical protein
MSIDFVVHLTFVCTHIESQTDNCVFCSFESVDQLLG